MKVDKEENGKSDVANARFRLKDVLKDLIHHDDSGTNSSGEETPLNNQNNERPNSKRQNQETDNSRSNSKIEPKRFSKRRRNETSQNNNLSNPHTSYIMKLFDRSVDLAKFKEDTPLYPICRAWILNQPHNPHIIVKPQLSSEAKHEPISSANYNGEDVFKLPPPDSTPIARVPSPLPEQREKDLSTDYLNLDVKPPSRDELWQMHQTRWVNVRQKWLDQAKMYEERYQDSFDILTKIYNQAQENLK